MMRLTRSRTAAPTWDDLPREWHPEHCDEVRAAQGLQLREHANPEHFTGSDLADFARQPMGFACPLCIHPTYPETAFAMIQRDVTLLLRWWMANGWSDGDIERPRFTLTPMQYEATITRFPHVRRYVEDYRSELGIVVMEAADRG